MRQLLPHVIDDVDPLEIYATDPRRHDDGRPWVMLDMIASADGATHVNGTSGPLGSDGDHRVFRAIRALADVILVAAGTVRSENYRPVKATEAVRAARAARGQSPVARLAILSRHLDFDFDSELFSGEVPPLLLTTDAAPESAVRRAETVTEVLRFASSRVSLREAIESLRQRGAQVVLAEGGPTLNGQLHDVDLIDELCMTLSPMLIGSNAPRLIDGARLHIQRLQLERVLEEDSWMFLRYTRATHD